MAQAFGMFALWMSDLVLGMSQMTLWISILTLGISKMTLWISDLTFVDNVIVLWIGQNVLGISWVNGHLWK